MINEWNEQYSPRKALQSPRKAKFSSVESGEEDVSPCESPRKSPTKSPSKKCRKEDERRRLFEKNKHALANSFLAEIDEVIGDNRVSNLADSTGGIEVIWSKKLSSTAGRANWKREAVRSRTAVVNVSAPMVRHYASIELAEKVIDDEGETFKTSSVPRENTNHAIQDRLYNVIAHEYCHLANFMISGIKDNPHGASFKAWAAKCTRTFKDRNIRVTTKHTYEITYKYIWECSSPTCGLEYKRHSKSVDPAKHSCGKCKSVLVQTKPVPRKGEGANKYQAFVKREHARVRAENPNANFGEIMVILGRDFRGGQQQIVQIAEREAVEVGKDIPEVRVSDLGNVTEKLDALNLNY